jgi:hypothetical protein
LSDLFGRGVIEVWKEQGRGGEGRGEEGRCTMTHSPDKSLMVISAGAAIVRYWVLLIGRVRVIAIEVDAALPNQVLCQKL